MDKEIEQSNMFTFEPNSDKLIYSLFEFDKLKRENKIFEIHYSERKGNPNFFIVDSSLYTLVKDSKGESFKKITGLEFTKGNYLNLIDCNIYYDIDDKNSCSISLKLKVNDAMKLSQQIQNIDTLKIKSTELGTTRLNKNKNFTSKNDDKVSVSKLISDFLNFDKEKSEREKLNSLSFESNSDKSIYSLPEFEKLQRNNKVFKIDYSQQSTKPRIYVINSSLYTPIKNAKNEINIRKITDFEFINTYSLNVKDFFIYYETDSDKKSFGMLENELDIDEISSLSQQIQSIATLNTKTNAPNSNILPFVKFKQQYELNQKLNKKVFKAPESDNPISYPKSYYKYRVKFIKRGAEQHYSNTNDFPIIRVDSETGSDYYLTNKNYQSDIDYFRKIDKIELNKSNYKTTITALLKSLPEEDKPNIIIKIMDSSYHLYNLLQTFKQENFTLIDPAEASISPRIQTEVEFGLQPSIREVLAQMESEKSYS